MRRTTPAALAACVACGLAFALALAPPARADASAPAPARAPTSAPAPDPIKQRADGILRAMHSNADEVRKVLSEARRKNDRAAVRCADQALSRANTALRLGRERAELARAASAARDGDESARQLQLLGDLYVEQARVLRGARACASGEVASSSAEAPSRVQVVVDPALPKVSIDPPRR